MQFKFYNRQQVLFQFNSEMYNSDSNIEYVYTSCLCQCVHNNNNNVFNSYRSTPRYIQCNIIYEKKRKFVQKRIQHGEWYNTTANCMLTDILSRMENAPSQPPSQPIHIARLRTTTPGTPETNRATRPTMHAKHNR